MILECPNCQTRYDLPISLPEGGRKVRCAQCAHSWHATEEHIVPVEPPKPVIDEEIAPENDIDFDDSEPAAPEPERVAAEPEIAQDIDFDKLDVSDTDLEAEWEGSEAIDAAAAAFEDEEPADEARAVAEVPGREAPPVAIGAARKSRVATAALAAGWLLLAAFVLGVPYLAHTKRVDVVRLLPGAAKAYIRLGRPVNIRGLQFEEVEYVWSVDAGRPTLEVRGDIVNVTSEPLKVPTVVFALRNTANIEIYQWAADVRTEPLAAHDRTRFVARIPTPPKSIRSVLVRFAKAR